MKILLSEKERKALIEGVWSGRYDPAQIPEWLFAKLSAAFVESASTGWGVALGSGPLTDLSLENAFRENLFYFAAHKEAHELKAMQDLLVSSKTKYNFVKEAIQTDTKWNYHWFNTEANVTERLARSGREWMNIQASKDIYEKLQFVAVLDPNTRDDHAALNGIVRPVDDDFWLTYYPPLDWNCRCSVEQVMEGADTDMEGVKLPDVEEQFATRVTDSREIWSQSHPYFQTISNESDAAIRNMVTNML